MTDVYDIVVIGGGIVGLATAYKLLLVHPRLSLLVVEKERTLAAHQSSHNSGVLHAGLYYAPGSLKARLCREGKQELERFAEERGIPFERCGKIVVALDESELPRLAELARRGFANGVEGLAEIGPERIREIEPHAAGIRALYSPATGIIDFARVAEAYGGEIRARGGEIALGFRVTSLRMRGGVWHVGSPPAEVRARHVIACAGLHADRIAALARSGATREGTHAADAPRGADVREDARAAAACHAADVGKGAHAAADASEGADARRGADASEGARAGEEVACDRAMRADAGGPARGESTNAGEGASDVEETVHDARTCETANTDATTREARARGTASDGDKSADGARSVSASLSHTPRTIHLVPFRGDYYSLVPSARTLVRGLIYPVPDPAFPFLGIHFTRRIDGAVWVGPSAVLAFAREGYSRRSVSLRDLAETLSSAGFRRLAWRYRRTGLAEMWRGYSKAAFFRAAQRYVPELRVEHLAGHHAGVRAQALDPSGALADDFILEGGPRILHVRNAPSPAATASLAIGRVLAEEAVRRFGLR
jgi:L-2-hydroxyglutarate oxidase